MKVLFTFLVITISLGLLAQSGHDSTTIIYSWRLADNYSTPEEIPIDTDLVNFQLFNTIYAQSICYSTLGNLGSPVISNIFSERRYSEDAFFLNQYLPYLNTADNLEFYNTRKPFTQLFYTNSGKSLNKEETVGFFFSQNINQKWNYGFGYDNISSKGQYKFLNVKKNSFKVLTSYTGKNYFLHAGFNLSRLRNDESAGIIDSSFKSGDYNDIKEIQTVFSGSGNPTYTSNAQSRLRYYDLMISQRLKLFTLATKIDTTNTENKGSFAEPILTYVVKMGRATKTYADKEPVTPRFYDAIYFNTSDTYDSLANYKLTNTLQFDFKTTIRNQVQVGVYGMIGNDLEKYSIYSLWDTTAKASYDTLFEPVVFTYGDTITANNDTLKGADLKKDISNTYFSAGIYGKFWNRVNARFTGTLYFIGEKAGQTSLDGLLNSRISILNKDYLFNVFAEIQNKVPGYLLNNYYSNHYVWTQNLNPENRVHLSSQLAAPSNNFVLRGNYYLIRNYIYFNQEAIPENYNQNLNIFSIEGSKTFRIWKIYLANRLIYQVSENESILPLPDLIAHNSTYFDYTFKFKNTGGLLRTILGVDTYYNTNFKGYEYMPALVQYYIQDTEIIGNYFRMDAFLNINIKRLRFFIKLQHFNSKWSEPNYYSSVRYPYNQFEIKYGISWTFYN